METDNLTDLFDDYLTGKMPETVHFEFEKRLKEDSAFNAEFKLHQAIIASLGDFRKAELKQFIAQNAQVISVPFYRRTNFYYAAMAAMFLLVGTFVLLNYNQTENKVAETMHEKTVDLADNNNVTDSDKTENKTAVELPPKIADSKGDRINQPETQTAIIEDLSSSEDVEDGMALDKDSKVAEETTPEKISNQDLTKKSEDTIKVESDILLLDTVFQVKSPSNGSTNSIKVEFWQSPINFKGYQWPGGKTLKIFGNFEPERLAIWKTESGNYYVVNNADRKSVV